MTSWSKIFTPPARPPLHQRPRTSPDTLASRLRYAVESHARPTVTLHRDDAETMLAWLEGSEERVAAYRQQVRNEIARQVEALIPVRTSGKHNYMPPCCREFGAVIIRRLRPPR